MRNHITPDSQTVLFCFGLQISFFPIQWFDYAWQCYLVLLILCCIEWKGNNYTTIIKKDILAYVILCHIYVISYLKPQSDSQSFYLPFFFLVQSYKRFKKVSIYEPYIEVKWSNTTLFLEMKQQGTQWITIQRFPI